MSILVKVLVGTAVVGGIGAAVAVAVDNHQQKEANKKVWNATNDVEKQRAIEARDAREKKSVIQRIKKYVAKKVIKFLAFVALHQEQIEAAGAVIGLGSAFISIAGSIRDFKNGNDTQEKLDWIVDRIQRDEDAMNHNNKVFGTACDFLIAKNIENEDEAKELTKTLDAIA